MNNELNTYQSYGQMDIANQNQLPVKSSATQVAETRAMSEIQAAVTMAKRDPRNENQCLVNILDSCKRLTMAESAIYSYPRGKTLVTGASIRLAEVMARHWKNLRIGITVTNQTADKTEARAYAYDMETNFMVDQEFMVPHKRTTKQGVTKLTDERDIREMVQNIGSRILRGCILRVIPADITEDAMEQCKKTMLSSDIPLSEQIKKMVLAFDEIGVKVEHLEKKLGHNLDATIPTEIVNLKSVYKSIKDGMASREDFFDFPQAKQADAKADLKESIEKNKKKQQEINPKDIDPETGEVIQ